MSNPVALTGMAASTMKGPLRILLTGVLLSAGCAGPLPLVTMHSHDPADPAAAATPFETPRNLLALGVETATQPEEVAPVHQHAGDPGTPLYVCPMHPEVTAGVPGRCPDCGMDLKITAAEPVAPLYVCPMHPEVTAGAPGRCPDCGMNLKIKEAR